MIPPHAIAANLAQAFLAGDWELEQLVERGARACGHGGRWLRTLARRVLTASAEPVPADALTETIEADAGFLAAVQKYELGISQIVLAEPAMRPAPGATWSVPPLLTAGQLADWRGVIPSELDWFADCQGRTALAPPGPLRHYVYRWLPKPSGRSRLLEIPKSRLKAIQRRVLEEILNRIPPHEAAHGCRPGRSIRSYVAPHVGQRIVLRMDLRHFYPSVRFCQVCAVFRTAGYPDTVARLLAGLCTNRVPAEVLATRTPDVDQGLFTSLHLPQGAPPSPALANLAVFRLDCRLAALADTVEARYTRYADDLAFSGGRLLERGARRFQVQVGSIVLEEGFALNMRKTRFMRQAVRQQLAGVVVNVQPALARQQYDHLRAILHNSLCRGPETQQRGRPRFREHLQGRIAYLQQFHPARAARLRALFDKIDWSRLP